MVFLNYGLGSYNTRSPWKTETIIKTIKSPRRCNSSPLPILLPWSPLGSLTCPDFEEGPSSLPPPRSFAAPGQLPWARPLLLLYCISRGHFSDDETTVAHSLI